METNIQNQDLDFQPPVKSYSYSNSDPAPEPQPLKPKNYSVKRKLLFIILLIFIIITISIGIFILPNKNSNIPPKQIDATTESSTIYDTNVVQIPDRGNYMVNGKLIGYEDNSIKLKMTNNSIIDFKYDETSKFFIFQDDPENPNNLSSIAQRYAHLSSSSVLLIQTNINKTITILFIKTGNQNIIESIYLE